MLNLHMHARDTLLHTRMLAEHRCGSADVEHGAGPPHKVRIQKELCLVHKVMLHVNTHDSTFRASVKLDMHAGG